jgi:hypothetical protein
MNDLLAAKSRLEAEGLDELGPVDHTIFKSIFSLIQTVIAWN